MHYAINTATRDEVTCRSWCCLHDSLLGIVVWLIESLVPYVIIYEFELFVLNRHCDWWLCRGVVCGVVVVR
jgi:hypothetical protein